MLYSYSLISQLSSLFPLPSTLFSLLSSLFSLPSTPSDSTFAKFSFVEVLRQAQA